MRKIVISLLALLVFALLTSSCGDSTNSSPSSGTAYCPDIDEKEILYKDADGDGYSDGMTRIAEKNDQPQGYFLPEDLIALEGDCNDADAAIHPGVAEMCNGIDDNCDGAVDEGVTSTFYVDADGDMYGDEAVSVQSCFCPDGYVPVAGDCDDENSSIYPDAVEECNGIDEDCDGAVDEHLNMTFYVDEDGDGYGSAAATVQACSPPAGFASDSTDCDDSAAAIHPGATEVCGNGIDEDCSGTPDDGCESTGIASLASKGFHNLILKEGGTVWAWGENYYGQLGNGRMEPWSPPVQVAGLSGVKAVAAGMYFSLALKDDGTVWAWGNNQGGQLGDGTTIARSTPVQVKDLVGVTAIAAGEGHGLALKGDGTVWAWGWSGYGGLGDGVVTQYPAPVTAPVQAAGLSGMKAVAGGGWHSLALKEDGTVWAWGLNRCGQLGNGDTQNQWTPVQVEDLSGATAIAAGGEHSLARNADGTVLAWGDNTYGELGIGTPGLASGKTWPRYYLPYPAPVVGLTDVIALAGGHYHSLALLEDGTASSWGVNWGGQLGDGTTTNRDSPGPVGQLSGITGLAAGYEHSFALTGDGRTWNWGDNLHRQLGNDTVSYQAFPQEVILP